MVTLKRIVGGLRIFELTDALVDKYERTAAKAFNGDGTCSLENMNRSCFASEFCAQGNTPAMQLRTLLHNRYSLVAVTDVLPDGSGALFNPSYFFVGCVSANPPSFEARRLFPRLPEDCIVISNLCVEDVYRGIGVGKRLIQAVLTKYKNDQCYLIVMKKGHVWNYDIENVFENRVHRLLKTYAQLFFTPCCECHEGILLRYNVNA